MSWHTVAYKYINTDTVIKDVKNNVNAHILKEIIAKLNFQYSIYFSAWQCIVQWFKQRVFLFCFLHDRAALYQVYYQSNSICNIIFLYILLTYTHFFLIYFLLFLLTNQFQVLWHKMLLQNCSPCPYSSKIPAVSGILYHSKILCSQPPQARSTKLAQALDKVGYQNTEVRGVKFIWFPW